MFIDILIVSILTAVLLVTLVRPICEPHRSNSSFENLKPQTDTAGKERSCAIINQRHNTQFL